MLKTVLFCLIVVTGTLPAQEPDCRLVQDAEGTHIVGCLPGRAVWKKNSVAIVQCNRNGGWKDCSVKGNVEVEYTRLGRTRILSLSPPPSVKVVGRAETTPAQNSVGPSSVAVVTPNPSSPESREVIFREVAYARLTCKISQTRNDIRSEDVEQFDVKVLDSVYSGITLNPVCEGVEKFDPTKFEGHWWLDSAKNAFNDGKNKSSFQILAKDLMGYAGLEQFKKNPTRASWWIGIDFKYSMPDGRVRVGTAHTQVIINIPELPQGVEPELETLPAHIDCSGKPVEQQNTSFGPGVVLTWFFNKNQCGKNNLSCDVYLVDGASEIPAYVATNVTGKLQLSASIPPGKTLAKYKLKIRVSQKGRQIKTCSL